MTNALLNMNAPGFARAKPMYQRGRYMAAPRANNPQRTAAEMQQIAKPRAGAGRTWNQARRPPSYQPQQIPAYTGQSMSPGQIQAALAAHRPRPMMQREPLGTAGLPFNQDRFPGPLPAGPSLGQPFNPHRNGRAPEEYGRQNFM